MAASLTVSFALSVLLTLLMAFGPHVEAADFNFSTASLAISEGGDLSQVLFINKTGENTRTIDFQVTVTPGTANQNNDYTPNDDHIYVFTSATTSLPIETQLRTDRAGESIEYFMICLPSMTVLQSMGAQAVSPTCVNITIIDDDSVVIGFQDPLTVTVMEGGPPQMVCAEVKDFGLQLDPFDSVPLDIRTGTGSEAVLGATSLTFEASNTVRCTTVSVPDNNLVDGTRTSQVILSEQTPVSSSVPTELYPGTTPLIIIDDDVIRFRFDRQQPFSYVLMEGDTLHNNISIMKYGNDTTLTFTVTPVVVLLGQKNPSSLDDINVIGSQFTPQVTRGTIVVEIPDDSESEDRKVFNLTITNSAVKIDSDDVSGAEIATEGDPIQITVYDNDFEIGFTKERIEVGQSSRTDVCIQIFNPHEIHPNTKIPLSISESVKNSTTQTVGVILETNDVILNATNTMVCINATLEADTCSGDTTLELSWTNALDNININFLRNSTAIALRTCNSSNTSATVTVSVTLVVLSMFAIVIITSILIILAFIHYRRKLNIPPRMDSENDENLEFNEDLANDHGNLNVLQPASTPELQFNAGTTRNTSSHSVQILSSHYMIPRTNTPQYLLHSANF